MAGWCCCDHWEHWANWKPQDFTIAEQSLRDQICRLRSHPSLMVWMNGSDNPPPPDVEQMYLESRERTALAEPGRLFRHRKARQRHRRERREDDRAVRVRRAVLLADDKTTQPAQCNPGGCGGAYGFNTETSPGPAVPPIESLRAMLPQGHLWPIDERWNYHAGGGAFKDIHVFTDALNARYGKATSVEDYAAKVAV